MSIPRPGTRANVPTPNQAPRNEECMMVSPLAKTSEKPDELTDTWKGEYGEYSSPPCFMHELDLAFLGLPTGADPTPEAHSPPTSASATKVTVGETNG